MLAAVVAVVTATSGVAGCGSKEPPEPDRLTACELLTRRQVATVLDRPVTGPPSKAEAATDTLAGRSGCAWSSDDGSRAVLVELVRTQDMSSSVRRTGFSAAARFDAVLHDHGADELGAEGDELGGRAVFVDEQATLHVLVDRSYLTFEVAATPPSAVEPIALDLARDAVDHLRSADPAD